MANKFLKGNKVIIIAGSSKGLQGKILDIKGDKVTVEGVNIKTIHQKPKQENPGKILKIEKPIHISNVSHIEEGKPVKVGFKIESEAADKKNKFKNKVRVSRKTGNKI